MILSTSDLNIRNWDDVRRALEKLDQGVGDRLNRAGIADVNATTTGRGQNAIPTVEEGQPVVEAGNVPIVGGNVAVVRPPINGVFNPRGRG